MVKIPKQSRCLDQYVAEFVMGFKWMRWHDLTHRGCRDCAKPYTRTLCPPGQWWDQPPARWPKAHDFVECDLHNPKERKLAKNLSGVPNYSTTIAYAFLVIEKMRTRGHSANIVLLQDTDINEVSFDGGLVSESGSTVAEAICRAAVARILYDKVNLIKLLDTHERI